MIRHRALTLWPAFQLVVLMSCLAACGLSAQKPTSPLLSSLYASTADRDTVATDDFWTRVAARSTPIVEPLSGSDSILITFLWRGARETYNVLVYGTLTGWLPPANMLDRVPRTDVWFLSIRARSDIRFTYRMAENDALRIYWDDPTFAARAQRFRPDPLNSDTVSLDGGNQVASHMTGPGFVPGIWTPLREPKRGRRDTLVLNGRTIRLYVPPLFAASDTVGLVVTLDGATYDRLASTPATVEALVQDHIIPPVLVVMIESRNRNADLPPNQRFVHFVADTLLAELAHRFLIAPDPARSVIVGSSLGGLAAAWLGYQLPDRFGNVIAQSGSYWWEPPDDAGGGWLPRLFAQGERRPLRFYLDAGMLETQPVRGGASMLARTQHFRDVLCAKGYEVAYRTFPGGHDYEHWRAMLPGALAWTLGSRPTPRGGERQGEAVEPVCRRLVIH